jgi:hypothetical protein
MSQLKFSYNEFLALILLYVSHSDASIDEAEKLEVKLKIGKSTFHHIIPVFESMSDAEILQAIADYKGVYFPTAEQKREILKDMSDVFFADGAYSVTEQSVFKMLERII